MFIRLFSTTTLFTLGAVFLTGAIWLLTPQAGSVYGHSFSELLMQSVLGAGLSGLLVDACRALAQRVYPAKKKPKFALRDVMNANLR